jgi:hypothetical protein
MALSDLTKQLAEQAIRSATTSKPAAPAPADSLGAAILGQVQAMQKALKEDEELAVLFHTGVETVRVLEIFFPAWEVAVLTSIDKDKNIARIISPVESLQLICKVMKVQPPAKPGTVRLVTPRPKSE